MLDMILLNAYNRPGYTELEIKRPDNSIAIIIVDSNGRLVRQE